MVKRLVGLRELSIVYPVTIVKTRYGGTYEGGAWAAFWGERIPEDAMGDDVSCSYWWDDNGDTCGVGATPDEAYRALEIQVAFGRAKEYGYLHD